MILNRQAKHPLLRARPPGQFYPDLVGVVPSYPKTKKAWEKMSKRMKRNWNRCNRDGRARWKGVKGRAGDKRAIGAIHEYSVTQGKLIVRQMKELGIMAANEDPRAEEMIEFACALVRAKDPTTKQFVSGDQARVAAMRLVLDFIKARPAGTSNVNVTSAEDWLKTALGDAGIG